MDSGLTREKQSESRECCRQVKVPSVYFPPHLQFHCHGRGVSANFNGRAQFAASSWRAAERPGLSDQHHRLPSHQYHAGFFQHHDQHHDELAPDFDNPQESMSL